MLPNRGLGLKGTEGLLINSYLMPLWVCCLGNLNRHWVNWQSLLDFWSNGQEEKGTRLDSRGRDAAVPAVGQTGRTSWGLGQIRGQGTGGSRQRQAWRASTEEVKAKKKAAVLGTTIVPETDTYANLLYKAGSHLEAIQWEEKAVQLGEGRDTEIADHLEKMKARQPTWPAS